MESNAFKTSRHDTVPRDLTVLSATAAGIVAVVVAFAVRPFGPAFVATTWLLVLVGAALALHPGRTRWCGTGLALAGVALPMAAFSWFWIALSFAVLT